MSTPNQSDYIRDLAVLKTKEFKEVKELVVANKIVGDDATIVLNANTVNEMTDAMTDQQASAFIDALISTEAPNRARQYSQKRVQKTIDTLDDIKKTVAGWTF